MIALYQPIFLWFKSDLTIKFGGQNKILGFEYFSEFQDSVVFKIKIPPAEFGTYAKMKYNFNELLILEPGVRINYYNVYQDSLYPDLRFGLKYLLQMIDTLIFQLGIIISLLALFKMILIHQYWTVG